MATSDVRVTLDNLAIARAVFPGGLVGNKMAFIGASIVTLARLESPKRSGRMSRSISAGPVRANGTKSSVRISVDVPYASYVLKGTYGPIHGHLRRDVKGRFEAGRDVRGHHAPQRHLLAVGRSQGVAVIYRRTVSGQTANDFLGRAVRTVVDRHTR